MLDPLGPLDPVETPKETEEDSGFSYCWEVTGCDRSDYLACQAYKQRKNCYELDRVICCSKNRINCPTCSVYIALNKTPTERARVHISTAEMDIEGYVHMPLRMRFSDYLNREQPRFIALTDATISQTGGPGSAIENELAVVNKSHIIMAWPIEKSESQKLAA